MNTFKFENNRQIFTFNLNRIDAINLSDINDGILENATIITVYYNSGCVQLSFDDPKEAKETYDKIVEAMEKA